jgi:uncharacterized protein (DUF433 family)
MGLAGCTMEPTVALLLETVSQLTGLSEARLRRWDNTGFFKPSYALPEQRRPHSRIYSLEDFIALQAIVRLLENGVPLRRLRDVVPLLKDVPADSWNGRRLHVVHGEVFFDRATLDRATASGAEGGASGVVTIDMASLARDAKRRVERLSERTPDQIGHVIRDRWIMDGVPVLAGTRIPTTVVFDLVRRGETPAEIVERYPHLTEEDVTAAVAYEEELLRRNGVLKRVSG